MKRGDVIVLLACLFIAGLLSLPRLFLPPASELVIISGEGRQEFSLQEDLVKEIDGVAVEIKGGRARIVSSPCRDKLCVKAGWLSRPGDAAVCLPQRVALQVAGGRNQVAENRNQEAGGADSVAY